jgi:hypothetical protein
MDGELYGCGRNAKGQLGLGHTDPVFAATKLPVSKSWKLVDCGGNYTLALDNDGKIYSCGTNANGQLGRGAGVGSQDPNLVQIGTASNWIYICAGNNCAFAINSLGELWGWGYVWLSYYELTSQYTSDQYTPVQLGTDTDWERIFASNGVVAIKQNGDAYGWGFNVYGNLGLGHSTSPQLTMALIEAGTDWQHVDLCYLWTTVVKSDGTLWAAGQNKSTALTTDFGAVNETSNVLKKIGSDSDWEQTAAYFGSNYGLLLALKQNGSLYACGADVDGMAGTGQSNESSTSFSPVSGSYIDIYTGNNNTYGRDASNNLWGWGSGGSSLGWPLGANNDPAVLADVGVPVLVEESTWSRLWRASPLITPPPQPTITGYNDKRRQVFFVTLTGAADALPDLVLPCSSASARLRSGSPSYLSVVVPITSPEQAEDIIARPNGNLVLSLLEGYDNPYDLTELVRVGVDLPRSDQGARSWSMTLVGYRQTTNSVPKTVEIDRVSYDNSISGSKRYRLYRAVPNLRAGDTASFPTLGGGSIVVASISLSISATSTTIEIAEE